MNNIIVGMGEALWDVLPEGKKIGKAVETSVADSELSYRNCAGDIG